ncbi:MAG: glycosyltransferase family 9 protein [Chlorobi bacterium]|nr:glycosyltransferase family 9 protein [Chlorobiota bacterium]
MHEYSDALRNNPNIDKLIAIDDDINFNGLRGLKRQIKLNNYDLIIDAHNNLRTFYLRFFLNCKKLKFKKHSFRKFLLVKFKINLMKDLPSIAERYCRMLTSSLTPLLKGGGKIENMAHPLSSQERGTEGELHLPEVFPDESSKQNVDELLTELKIGKDKKLICIVPSSKHFTKTYPAEYYSELINKFDSGRDRTVFCPYFLLIGKGNDKINIGKIKSQTGSNIIDLCNKLNILEMAELMKKCWLVISGDTGPMHIAEAVNAPLIMLAGSSVREFGFYPQNKNSLVLENNELKCRPCSHIGRSSCPKGHFKCMVDIKPEQIFEKIQ